MIPFFTFKLANPLLSPVYMLISQILIVGSFGIAAYYIVKYLKSFYKDRPVPKEWNYFWLAMLWGTIHELIEMAMLYRMIGGQLTLILYFLIQFIAGIYLISGSYLLAKKYIVK
jgi:hypothetical protein